MIFDRVKRCGLNTVQGVLRVYPAGFNLAETEGNTSNAPRYTVELGLMNRTEVVISIKAFKLQLLLASRCSS